MSLIYSVSDARVHVHFSSIENFIVNTETSFDYLLFISIQLLVIEN